MISVNGGIPGTPESMTPMPTMAGSTWCLTFLTMNRDRNGIFREAYGPVAGGGMSPKIIS
jgi:hypothetical protein